jgi:hypothetical protein
MADDEVMLIADHLLSIYRPHQAISVAREIASQSVCSGPSYAVDWLQVLALIEEREKSPDCC